MRLIVPLVAATVFALFAALYAWWPQTYAVLLEAWAVPIGEIPFIDFHAVLAAIQCHRLGEDVLVTNRCDLIGRPHVYSPLWLVLPMAADVQHTMAWGVGLAVALVIALATLPLPATPRAVAVMLAAVLSPSVVLAVERANNDMVVLLLAVLAGHLLARGPGLRLIAYGLLIGAALLKYYPAAALALALRESRARFLVIAAVSLASAVALGIAFADRWAESARLLVWVLRFGLYTFSLRNPIEYAVLDHPQLHEQPLHGLAVAALLAVFAALVWGWLLRLRREGLMVRLDQPADMLLAVSGLLIAGCFVSGSSLPYRAVLVLPAFPALLSGRRSAGVVAAILVFLLWLPLLHHAAAPLVAGGGLIGTVAGVWQALLITAKEIGWWLATSFLAAAAILPIFAFCPTSPSPNRHGRSR
mgnify:CR=1 FL=1